MSNKLAAYIHAKTKVLTKHPIAELIVLSLVLNFFLEMLSRRSFIQGVSFITSSPYTFFYNMLIILISLSVSLLFYRKSFVMLLISGVWAGLGIANFVLLGFRTTPLTAIDFYILRSIIDIIPIYLSTLQMVLITSIFIIAFAVLVLAWQKFPKKRVLYRRRFLTLGLTVILFITIPGISATNLGNLVDAYSEYGFAYCFSTSMINRGIDEPDEYTEENLQQLLSTIKSQETNQPTLTPNIIMVQLESFFDVNLLKGLTFSENPLPNFTRLKSDFSSGFLTVPSIGAGTANTEFEVLSAMNLEYFGFGEYPYKTILQSSTTETIGYNLRELGYTSHAIHNNTGTFYDRNMVFPNMGFDYFTSIEYMNDVEFNPIGWAKDSILTTEIMTAMENTSTKDFIYAISVQGHGKYPTHIVDETQRITLMGALEESETIAYEYFVNQIHEMDSFLGNLTTELSSYEEPVVLVMFGDHLPSLSIENEDLRNGDRFQAEYVIWSNFPMDSINQDLTTYQLSSYIMERLGMNNGLLTKLHQNYADKDAYQDKLVLLQYDMLYGDKYVYDGVSPFPRTKMQMGTSFIRITEVTHEQGNIHIQGEGFTPWSKVYIDEKAEDTVYIDQNTLMVLDESPETGSSIFVAQVNDNERKLSQTPEWIYE